MFAFIFTLEIVLFSICVLTFPHDAPAGTFEVFVGMSTIYLFGSVIWLYHRSNRNF